MKDTTFNSKPEVNKSIAYFPQRGYKCRDCDFVFITAIEIAEHKEHTQHNHFISLAEQK